MKPGTATISEVTNSQEGLEGWAQANPADFDKKPENEKPRDGAAEGLIKIAQGVGEEGSKGRKDIFEGMLDVAYGLKDAKVQEQGSSMLKWFKKEGAWLQDEVSTLEK